MKCDVHGVEGCEAKSCKIWARPTDAELLKQFHDAPEMEHPDSVYQILRDEIFVRIATSPAKINYRDKNGGCSAAADYTEQKKCGFYTHSVIMECCVLLFAASGRCGSFQAYLASKEEIKC